MAKLSYRKQKSLSRSKSEQNSLLSYYGFTKKDQKEYPVITKILKQLTPERIKKENEAVKKIKLPPELQKWIREYEKVGNRNDYIWKWTYLAMRKLTLPTVIPKYRKSVLTAKICSIILNVLVDDLADKRKNKKMLEEAINICFLPENYRDDFLQFDKKDRQYLNLIKKIWFFLNRNIKKYPRYKKFKDIFLYDYQQFFAALRYSYLVNKNLDLINLTEYQIYLSNNMQGMIGSTIDLMASPKFDIKELRLLREIMWRAQRMGRIGNSLTTWKREILEEDFSSELFGYALVKNILTKEDLKRENKSQIVQKIEKSNIKNHFLKEWEKYYKEIKDLSKRMKSFSSKEFLSGLENLMLMHIYSEDFK